MTDEMRVNMEPYVVDPEHQIIVGMLQCRNRTKDALKRAFDRTTASRIDDLWKSGHFGCFEEAFATITAHGVSRSLLAQITRHRLFSFKVISMRAVPYVSQSVKYRKLQRIGEGEEGLDIIIPPSISGDELNFSIFHDLILMSRNVYQTLIDNGVPEEDARYGALIGTETQIRLTSNLRNWLHFLNLRTPKSRDRDEEYVPGKGPQWEIRNLAWMCYDILKEYAPNVFAERHMDKWVYV